jgi:hypothetical protein
LPFGVNPAVPGVMRRCTSAPLPRAATPPFSPTQGQEDRAVIIAVLNRPIDSFIRYSYSPATATRTGAADQALGATDRTALTSHQHQVNFALAWARWEPAFVAQQHREWFGC